MARSAAHDALATRGSARAGSLAANAPRAGSLPAWRDEPLVWLGAQAAVLAGAVSLQLSQPLNHDVGWLLVGARRLLAGAALYREGFLDVNPPTTLALFAPAVATARALGLAEIPALRAWVFALCVASLLVCRRLLAQLFAGERAALPRATLLAISFVALVLPNRDFGQREHVIVLLLLPYLLASALRAAGGALPPRLAIAIGAAAGGAGLIKPHYALVVAAAEIVVCVRRRSGRALASRELAAFAATFAAGAFAIATLYPDYHRVALPLAAETYGAYQSPLATLVRAGDLALLAAALVATALVARGGTARTLAAVLAGASVAAWVAFLLGGTWWDYHRLPMRAFALATLGLAAAKLLARPLAAEPAPHSRAGAAAAGVCAFAITAGLLIAAPLRIGETLRAAAAGRGGELAGAAREIVEVTLRRGRGGAIWSPASSVDPAFPAVNYAGVEWASRLSCLWPLPAAIRARALPASDGDPDRRERLDALARSVVAMVIEDLERARPELIFVSRERDNLALSGLGFDFLAFFERKPRFAALWSQYAWVEDTPSFRVFARRASATDARALTNAR